MKNVEKPPINMTASNRDLHPFLFIPGRYYYAMCSIPFPCCEDHPNGGDVTGLVWRFHDDPAGLWRVTYRHAYYNSLMVGNSVDEKNWYSYSAGMPPDRILRDFCDILETGQRAVFSDHPEIQLGTFDSILIQGDCDRAMQLLMSESRPAWLHILTKDRN